MFTTLFCFAVILGLILLLFYQHSIVIVAERTIKDEKKQIQKEREAVAAIMGLTQTAISTEMEYEAFLSSFIEYVQRTLLARGAAVLIAQTDASLRGCAVAGIFPPLREVTGQIEQQLLAHSAKHTDFIRDIKIENGIEIFSSYINKEKGYGFFKGECPDFFPKNFIKNAPRSLLAPILFKGKIFAFVIVVSGEDFDEHKLSEAEGNYLVRLNAIASLSIEAIRAFRERREYEKQLQTAREEGMLQVSAGIIHNIGNAITVAKLTALEMKEKFPEQFDQTPEAFLNGEIIPLIEEKIAKNEISEFLKNDKVGSQIIPMIKELLANIARRSKEMITHIKSLSDKLQHISEIIELQQRFVGELGTENLVPLSQVVESSIKIFDETFNKYKVAIGMHVEENLPKVLIDTSMMTQVFINLIKNAVEAMQNMPQEREKKINIFIYSELVNAKPFIAAKVEDNGPGIDPSILNKLFQFGFSTKEKSRHSRGYGLHSCLETVKKYGGDIKVESKPGEGSSFIVLLPSGEKK